MISVPEGTRLERKQMDSFTIAVVIGIGVVLALFVVLLAFDKGSVESSSGDKTTKA